MFVFRQLISDLNVNKPVSNFLERIVDYYLLFFRRLSRQKSPTLYSSTPKLEAVVSENSFDTFN